MSVHRRRQRGQRRGDRENIVAGLDLKTSTMRRELDRIGERRLSSTVSAESIPVALRLRLSIERAEQAQLSAGEELKIARARNALGITDELDLDASAFSSASAVSPEGAGLLRRVRDTMQAAGTQMQGESEARPLRKKLALLHRRERECAEMRESCLEAGWVAEAARLRNKDARLRARIEETRKHQLLERERMKGGLHAENWEAIEARIAEGATPTEQWSIATTIHARIARSGADEVAWSVELCRRRTQRIDKALSLKSEAAGVQAEAIAKKKVSRSGTADVKLAALNARRAKLDVKLAMQERRLDKCDRLSPTHGASTARVAKVQSSISKLDVEAEALISRHFQATQEEEADAREHAMRFYAGMKILEMSRKEILAEGTAATKALRKHFKKVLLCVAQKRDSLSQQIAPRELVWGTMPLRPAWKWWGVASVKGSIVSCSSEGGVYGHSTCADLQSGGRGYWSSATRVNPAAGNAGGAGEANARRPPVEWIAIKFRRCLLERIEVRGFSFVRIVSDTSMVSSVSATKKSKKTKISESSSTEPSSQPHVVMEWVQCQERDRVVTTAPDGAALETLGVHTGLRIQVAHDRDSAAYLSIKVLRVFGRPC